MKYYKVLQTDVVTASGLFCIAKNFTCEHGPKIEISTMRISILGPCSWCLNVLKKKFRSVFVGSNQPQTDKISFPQSFKNRAFFILTLRIAPTSLQQRLSNGMRGSHIWAMFVVPECDEENTSERVRGL